MKKPRETKTKKAELTTQSIAKSRLFSIEEELGLTGLFEGKVYHLSFDCPKKLGLAFKQATHDNGTTICKELQKYMLSYIATDHAEKTAYGNTLSKVLNPTLTIENLNFEQYCQSRPRRYMRHVEPENITAEGDLACQIAGCVKSAVGRGVHRESGKVFRLCKLHLEAYADNPQAWRLFNG